MPARVPTRLGPRLSLELAELGLAKYPAGGLPKEIDLSPAFPGYVLVRRDYVGRVLADRRDPCREPFIFQYDVRRLLRGCGRGSRRFDKRPLKPTPSRNRKGRWQLELRFSVKRPEKRAKTIRTPYARVVGLSLCPCTVDDEGYEVEPFWVNPRARTKGRADTEWEVHHASWSPRNNTVGNLYTLPRAVHKKLKKPQS